MKGPELLQKHADVLKSSMGACFPGDRAVFRGYDLHADLKELSWMELYLFGITGRRFSEQHLQLLQAIWVYTSYPDARIWNNRVAALAGSSRSTGSLAVSAALAVSEASIYGRGIDVRSFNFIVRTRKAVDKGVDLADCVQAELKKYRGIAGFGRPLTSDDERIAPFIALAERCGLGNGPHVRLVFAIDEYLSQQRLRLRMNFAAIVPAVCADLGLSLEEYYFFVYPAFIAGMPPCYLESAGRTEGTLFPLSCGHIRYEGNEKRSWSPQGE